MDNKQVARALNAINELVSGKSPVSSKVQNILSLDTSWVRTSSRRSGLITPDRPPNRGKIDKGKTPVTLDSKKLLQPHNLSLKVKVLAAENKLNEAVELVKLCPLDALNVSVWNTLIWEANKAQRYTLAWSLFTEMKRRGFEPSTYSYKTMLNGISRIDDFKTFSLALERSHGLYEGFIKYTNKLKAQHPNHPELWPTPINFYINILSMAGLRQQMWSTFYAMDKTGPLAPNAVTFADMFRAISRRSQPDGTAAEWDAKVGSEAALLWRLMATASKANPGFEIDSHALCAALRLLGKGEPENHVLAFQIVDEFLGLGNLGNAQETKKPKVEMNEFVLQAVLDLCITSNKPEMCVQYGQQIIESRAHNKKIDVHNMNQLFNAYFKISTPGSEASKKSLKTLEWLLGHASSLTHSFIRTGKNLWPTLTSYHLVLASCRECGDWESARTVYELMSRDKIADIMSLFKDGQPYQPRVRLPILDHLSPVGRRNRTLYNPTSETLSSLMRCATARSNPSHAQECLRIVNSLGGAAYLFDRVPLGLLGEGRAIQELIDPQNSRNEEGTPPEVLAARKRESYWIIQAAAAIPSVVNLGLKTSGWVKDEVDAMVKMKARAIDILKKNRERVASSVPFDTA